MNKIGIGKFIFKSILLEAVVLAGVYTYKKYKEDPAFIKNMFCAHTWCNKVSEHKEQQNNKDEDNSKTSADSLVAKQSSNNQLEDDSNKQAIKQKTTRPKRPRQATPIKQPEPPVAIPSTKKPRRKPVVE